LNPNTLLRTHTSAHQTELISSGETSFLVVGDCYRRDTIDATHYPIFHQMEGVRIFDKSKVSPSDVEKDMKHVLSQLFVFLLGNTTQVRWIDEYFPFTFPSFEMEVHFQNNWLEVLGCGLIHEQLLANCGKSDKIGWAFGQGLERLAMILYQITDIRLFWSSDPRFWGQFNDSHIDLSHEHLPQFQPYSKFPPCYKDISFWVGESFHENDFFEIVREIAQENVEDVILVSQFTHPTTKRVSHCYRINFRSMERNLTNEETNKMYFDLRKFLTEKMDVELR
jgi:phenylalanyl-tRNA synthetase alpha chain